MRITLWRIVSRHVRTSLAGTNKHRGVRALVFFLRNAWRYYRRESVLPSAPDDDSAVTRAAKIQALKGFDTSVVRCHKQSDITTLLQSIRRDAETDATAP